MSFYPISTAEKMVASFCDCTLPLEEWDHGTHLVMGLYMLAKHGESTYPVVKERLIHYTACYRKQGYHETMTRFWLEAIRHFFSNEAGEIKWNQEELDNIIFHEELTRRNFWNDYYSKELMMSEKAKTSYVLPDLQAFPSN